MTKEELRVKARKYRPPYTPEEIRRRFAMLGKMLLAKEGVSAFFAALPGEPDLQILAHEARKRGPVLYPRTEGGGLVFVPVENEGLMKPGAFGIAEPAGEAFTGKPALIFVPGLMFGKNGSRLGRGGAFYDRYLAGFEGVKIGVCFAANLRRSLPMEPHDIFMDFVLTENELIDARASYRSGSSKKCSYK